MWREGKRKGSASALPRRKVLAISMRGGGLQKIDSLSSERVLWATSASLVLAFASLANALRWVPRRWGYGGVLRDLSRLLPSAADTTRFSQLRRHL